ncbi:uncharacterized protein STEHIDRAFT_113920 [Stereum hirsutum FP-91666 SS1]|uniref:uncharacterized protein n=1 Tax=Stereum hirsutum (strain FP-91666) TaxID=721885 RepID=UPI00044499C3|nr:uncharacterized protein STEHIDRAFT_113920 [Stereum hirsutum FP-91666 SS1]EIM82823.1 hypothetical protein STEHIDRAFT_113920 [Stereum hirsutum FP-91666 SS1]
MGTNSGANNSGNSQQSAPQQPSQPVQQPTQGSFQAAVPALAQPFPPATNMQAAMVVSAKVTKHAHAAAATISGRTKLIPDVVEGFTADTTEFPLPVWLLTTIKNIKFIPYCNLTVAGHCVKPRQENITLSNVLGLADAPLNRSGEKDLIFAEFIPVTPVVVCLTKEVYRTQATDIIKKLCPLMTFGICKKATANLCHDLATFNATEYGLIIADFTLNAVASSVAPLITAPNVAPASLFFLAMPTPSSSAASAFTFNSNSGPLPPSSSLQPVYKKAHVMSVRADASKQRTHRDHLQLSTTPQARHLSFPLKYGFNIRG